MGRGKLSMKLITNEKSRKTTFCKRKKSLMRKAYELSTLCDVRTCLLIYGPKQGDESGCEVHTWPQCRREMDDMIKAYKSNRRAGKVFDLFDFFSERKKKVETEISKFRRDIAEIKYPKWDDRLESLSEHQLRLLIHDLDSKIDTTMRRIDFFIGNHYMVASEGMPTMAIINSDFLFEDKIPTFGNETQMSFNHQIPIEEAAASSFTPSQNLFSENSIPMMDSDVNDLSQLWFGSNGSAQIQYNHGHFQSPIYDNPTMTLMDPNYSLCHCATAEVGTSTSTQSVLPLSYMRFADQASNSPMMFTDASGQVNDQFDSTNCGYMMKNNNF